MNATLEKEKETPVDVLPATEPRMIQRSVTEDHVCVLTFDRPDSAANVFDKATLAELNEHLDFIAGNPQFKGLVIASAKKSIFIAGADLHALSTATEQGLREIIELGQVTFNRIADMNIPTVAAIHGAAVGGGYEICLACDYRIASSDKSTKIGLPETQLGILPAWGGATRLPRLIGLPKALDIILGGKTVAAKLALKLGMVDEVVPKEYVLTEALKRISRGRALKKRRKTMSLRALNSGLAASILHKRIEPMLQKKTRGNYPALPRALEVATEGIRTNEMESMLLERAAILELTKTEAAKNLIRVFFLQERAKKLRHAPSEKARPIKKIAVIGAGVMGAGIAQWAAARDIEVVLRDIGIEPLAKGMATITKLFDEGAKRHVFTKVEARAGIDRILPSAMDVPLKNTEFVIEAAVEKMDLKKKVFQRISELAGPRTILATNTSALSVSELAATIPNPDRVVGIHFFNPVHRMQLVEVIVGKQTSPEVVQRSVEFVQQLGKLPVVVKDSPGFLVNRILMPYLIEAGHLFENGARVEDIDEGMLEFGMPMGPLRLTDEVGVDVANHVGETIAKSFSPRLTNPAVLEKMMKAGLLGKKSGRGFYIYSGKKSERVNTDTEGLRAGTSAVGLEQKELQTRMVMLMINEAARCLEENLVGEAADVDFGMIMGTGFAPFTGGPLRFADHVGVPKIVEDMNELTSRAGERFAPCALLITMAKENRTFYK
jgi:3-hydroxyacyl-CoA dehydrogenase / enoyl-CoA hydratase / 3-hydroxybutyryl-CoA epimerase